ncbi:MAG: hypothetical protein FWD31_08490, partial [Planctomycetaceae bacterium]|nr:hypothetical protein [Planctomycetaceae bacterium]
LKPTRTDLVLDVVNGMVYLVIWGIILVAAMFPALFPGTIEREHFVSMTQMTVLLGVVYFWATRYPRLFQRKIFERNPPDNSVRRHRIHARCGRLCFIVVGLFFLWINIKIVFALEDTKRLDEILRYVYGAMVVSLVIWVWVRTRKKRL